MNPREWEISPQDVLLKKIFKDECQKHNVSIRCEGVVWLEEHTEDITLQIQGWEFLTPTDANVNIDARPIIQKYLELRT